MKPQGIGIPFYSSDEWENAKRQMQDPHTFHDTYAQFVQDIEHGERQLRAQGMATVRVHIVVDEFIAWCNKAGRQINSKARSDYAAIKAVEMDKGR